MSVISKSINLSSEASIAYDILKELDRLLGIVSQVGFTAAIGVFDSQAPSINGFSVVTTTLYAQSADSTHPGMVNTSTQTFAGAKTFTSVVTTPSIVLTGASAATVATTGTMTTTLTNLRVITITPTGACLFNALGGFDGQDVTFAITTSGVSSFVLTFGTNFKSSGTVTTGVTSGKIFTVTFRHSGSNWVEISRSGPL